MKIADINSNKLSEGLGRCPSLSSQPAKDQLSIYRTEVNTKVQQLVDEMLIGKSTPEETQEKLIKEINAILAN